MRRVQIKGFFWSYFPVFGINTEVYRVNLPIQSECRIYGPEKTPYLDTFHTVKWDKTDTKTATKITGLTLKPSLVTTSAT